MRRFLRIDSSTRAARTFRERMNEMVKQTTLAQDSEFTTLLLGSIIDFDAALALEWVRDNFDPQDIFEDDILREWAASNGFIEEK